MFDRLVESGPRQHRGWAQSGVSLGAHAVLGLLAIAATRAAPASLRPHLAEPVIFSLPTAPRAPDRPAASKVGDGSLPRAPKAPASMPSIDPAISFPLALPPSSAATPFDARALTARRDADSVFGDVRGVDASIGRALSGAEVDEPAQLTVQPTPEYPPAMRSAGITGRVTVRYVVDTLGRVEQGSVVVVDASHAAFVPPTEAAIAQARFRPARFGGRRVRQLVEQAVVYAIQGR
jgi:periplasmic protein TonB